MCTLDPYTSEDCFAFDASTGTITDYYDHENNDKNQTVCLREVIIPSMINGVEVTTIGRDAFQNNKITNVEIPDSVTTIGPYSFAGNSITNLKLPDSVNAIGRYAFVGNSIETLILPNNYFTVEIGVFSGNNLSSENAFVYARKKTGEVDYTTIMTYGGAEKNNVIIPSQKNGIKLTTIGSNAFNGQGIKGVTIPEGVTKISDYAFAGNSITNLELPDSVTSIMTHAFEKNSITNLEIPKSVSTIGRYAFSNNNLTSVIIKNKQENVTIESQAFGTFDTTNIVWDYVEE